MKKNSGVPWKEIWGWVRFVVLAIAAVAACCLAISMLPKSNAKKTDTHITPEATPITEPATEPTKEPTKAAEMTPTGKPTPTSTLPPTPTDIPTPAPLPTDTPMPTPTPVVADGTLLYECRAGEDAYYRFYDDGTLLVTGTGRVDSLDAEMEYDESSGSWYEMWTSIPEDYKKLSDAIFDYQSHLDYPDIDYGKLIRVIVEEGITELGDFTLSGLWLLRELSLPSTLTSIGDYVFFADYFYNPEDGFCTTIHGLSLDIEISRYAFIGSDIESVQEAFQEYAKYPPTPTPTMTPTPTPTPDPEKPRLAHTMQIEKDVTYEFWDNGYLYIKGKGKINDKEWGFELDRGSKNPETVGREFLNTIRYIVIEEGITYIGANSLWGLHYVEEWWLPSTLMGISNEAAPVPGDTVHGYYEGKAVTLTRSKGYVDYRHFFDYFEDPEWAENAGITISWEE